MGYDLNNTEVGLRNVDVMYAWTLSRLRNLRSTGSALDISNCEVRNILLQELA